ncbi:MAG: hypothetical protein WBM35_16235 [Candidatus Electrothrix sp.]
MADYESIRIFARSIVKKNDIDFIKKTKKFLRKEKKPPLLIFFLSKISALYNRPYVFLEHKKFSENEYSAASDICAMSPYKEKIINLMKCNSLNVVKTITVKVILEDKRSFMLLIFGTSDFRLNAKNKTKISNLFSSNKNKMRFYINPDDFDSVDNLGLSRGYVGPLVYSFKKIDKVIYLKEDADAVHFRVTPFHSIVISVEIFDVVVYEFLKCNKMDYVVIR